MRYRRGRALPEWQRVTPRPIFTAMAQGAPRRLQTGVSARKRKESRTTPVVPLRIEEGTGEGPAPMDVNDETHVEPVAGRAAQDEAGGEDYDVHTTTPEVSED